MATYRLFILPVLVPFALNTAPTEGFTELDRLHDEDRQERILALIQERLPAARSHTDSAALLWRRARAQLTLADYGRWEEALSDREAIALLREAEENAHRAMELDPPAAEPWFWKGATMGLRGQIQGVLNSLFMASDVRDYATEAINRNDRFGEAYYLLGQLYRELPGRPFSFGNREYAVSLLRMAVAVHEEEYRAGVVGARYYDNYTQLAEGLWRRNHSADRRRKRHAQAAEQYRQASTPLERGFAFEGSQPLGPGSDREEAVRLVEMVVSDLSRVRQPNTRERKDLASAQALLSQWR